MIEVVKNENYKDILENSKLTSKGNEIKKEWKCFQDYLKSEELTEYSTLPTDCLKVIGEVIKDIIFIQRFNYISCHISINSCDFIVFTTN